MVVLEALQIGKGGWEMRSAKRLTKEAVDRLKPDPKEVHLWDGSLPGFGVKATALRRQGQGGGRR